MQAVLFAILCVCWLLLVTFRRLFRGPLHEGWSFSYEALVEILRRSAARGITLPVEDMRRGILSARIHPRIKRHLAHSRGSLAEVPTEEFVPNGWKDEAGTLLYYHGGGYIVCGPHTHRDLISRISVASGARAIAIDYRKAPEHPFPAGIEDSLGAYRALLDQGVPADRIVLGGDSAGGGLVLAVLQRVREAGLPMPRAGILLSPWCDVEGTGESVTANAPFDYIPRDGLVYGRELYLKGQDPRHPHASPAYADLAGFPPLLMQTGGAELFLSENRALAERAAEAGVSLRHEIEPRMVHVFQAFASFLPECEPAIHRLGEFIRSELGRTTVLADEASEGEDLEAALA